MNNRLANAILAAAHSRGRVASPAARLDAQATDGPSELLAMSTPRAAWQVAWPLAATMGLSLANGLVDTWLAGGLGATAQATVGLTYQVVLTLNACLLAAGVGCQVFVARRVGAGDWPGAARAAQQAILAAVGLSLLLGVPFFIGAHAIFAAMGAAEAVCAEGAAYLRVLLAGLVPMSLGMLVTSVFMGRGDVAAKLVPAFVETVVWLACSLGFVLGLGLGLPGLAAAFVLGKLAGSVLIWRTFRASALGRHMACSWRPDYAAMRRMLRVGLPAGIQNMARNGARMAIFAVLALAASPADAIAAYAIGFRLESVCFLPIAALGVAAATLVGQHLGAGDTARAAAAGRTVTAIAVALSALTGAGLFLLAEPAAGLFTTDPLVWVWTVELLRVLAVGLPFLALGLVLSGALQGAGETVVPMGFTLAAQFGLGVPLAWWLSQAADWGPLGVWWAITAMVAAHALLTLWWFERGRWRDRGALR